MWREYLIQLRAKAVNHSLMHGVVTKEWKTSTIKPLSKIAVAEDLNQLRPINTLPTLSKVMEKLVIM